MSEILLWKGIWERKPNMDRECSIFNCAGRPAEDLRRPEKTTRRSEPQPLQKVRIPDKEFDDEVLPPLTPPPGRG